MLGRESCMPEGLMLMSLSQRIELDYLLEDIHYTNADIVVWMLSFLTSTPIVCDTGIN